MSAAEARRRPLRACARGVAPSLVVLAVFAGEAHAGGPADRVHAPHPDVGVERPHGADHVGTSARPPFGAPGPEPFGAPGPEPFGAAGPPPLGAAGPPPFEATGPPPFADPLPGRGRLGPPPDGLGVRSIR